MGASGSFAFSATKVLPSPSLILILIVPCRRPSGVPDYMIRGGSTYRILTDHLGSPRVVVDASTGAEAQRMGHDEWGNLLQDTNPGFIPFGYAGGLWDADTHLVRFGARDCDPDTGRWRSKEPLRFDGGLNFYLYALGDPINTIDLDGLDPDRGAQGNSGGGAGGSSGGMSGGGTGAPGAGGYAGNPGTSGSAGNPGRPRPLGPMAGPKRPRNPPYRPWYEPPCDPGKPPSDGGPPETPEEKRHRCYLEAKAGYDICLNEGRAKAFCDQVREILYRNCVGKGYN